MRLPNPIKRCKRRGDRRLGTDTSGAAFAEYLVVVVVVALVGITAIGTLGVPMIRTYYFIQALVGLPVP